MLDILPWIGLALSLAASAYCWRHIWTSNDHSFYKGMATLIATLPFVGPLLYAYMEMAAPPASAASPKKRPQPGSKLLRYWTAHEHIYLSWAALVFVVLGALAWWLHGWQPGNFFTRRY